MVSVTVSQSPLQPRYPNISVKPLAAPPSPSIFSSILNSDKNPKISTPNIRTPPKTHVIKPLMNPTTTPRPLPPAPLKDNPDGNNKSHCLDEGDKRVLVLCGFGYLLQGFRCFPWLALNYYMAQGLNLHPSTLQLVQYSAGLPMVAKPLYGVLSDAVYFGDAHRLPYISFGALLQALSWGSLALMTLSGDALSVQMAIILLSNLGASFTEVAGDAFVAELSNKRKVGGLQSYAFMALAAGGIFGNLFGGFFVEKVQQPGVMFLTFALLLSFQLAVSLTTRENSVDSPRQANHHLVKRSISENLRKHFSDLITAINKESIFHPLSWVVASIAVVPMLSGTTFCYQTQHLKINPSIIGMSKVIGQLIVLSATVIYNRCLKRISLRKLICGVQIIYALSILSDLFLVTQCNVKLGISNEAYVLCLSALAEAVAQFKILPFTVLFTNLCPGGCEGSLIAFFASALCLSSTFSGFLGIGLANLIGISSEDFSSLPVGILFQFLAALLPLGWISCIPISHTVRRMRRRKRKVRVVLLPSNTEVRGGQ